LDLDALKLDLDFDKLLATPEQNRRSLMSNHSSAARSIDPPRGIFSKGSSFGGSEAEQIVTQFEANDEDMAYLGFNDDDYGFFLPSGPEDPTSGLESYKRASLQSDLNVPIDVQIAPMKKSKSRQILNKSFDEETQLSKEQLLLNQGEALIDGNDGSAKDTCKELFGRSLVGLLDINFSSLWSKSLAEAAVPKERKNRPVIAVKQPSDSFISSDHVQSIR